MTYVAIDTSTKEGKAFATYAKSLGYVITYGKANATTIKAVNDAKEGRLKKRT